MPVLRHGEQAAKPLAGLLLADPAGNLLSADGDETLVPVDSSRLADLSTWCDCR